MDIPVFALIWLRLEAALHSHPEPTECKHEDAHLAASSLGSLKLSSAAPRNANLAPGTCRFTRASTSASPSDISEIDCCDPTSRSEDARLPCPSCLETMFQVVRTI